MSARPQHGSPARPLPVGLGWLAIMLTALCLVPAGAHLFALPNKLGLAEGEYFTAQSVYRGWSLFGVVWLLTLLAQLAMLVVLRRHRAALSVGLLGLGLLVAAFAVFFVWTLPANQATANWTQVPAAWRTLRTQWEFSHAVGAVLILGSLACVTWAALRAGRGTAPD